MTYATRCTFAGCCARADREPANAALPIRVMKFRRLTQPTRPQYETRISDDLAKGLWQLPNRNGRPRRTLPPCIFCNRIEPYAHHYMHAANSISGSANTSYGNAHASGAFVWGVPSLNCANVAAQALPAYSQQSAIDVEKCIFSVSAPRARALQAGTSEGMPMPWQRSVAATACAPATARPRRWHPCRNGKFSTAAGTKRPS